MTSLATQDRTVYKYPLALTEQQDIVMPRGTTILSVQMQDGVPCIWALVGVEAAVRRRIVIAGTGNALPKGAPLRFIGTVQDGRYVWHVWEMATEVDG